MTEWLFDYNEVLEDSDGYWWHVVDRLESIDGTKKQYELADATHTEYKTLHKLDVEGLESEDPMFESCGWSTDTKPAAENGFRVNGVLCGPGSIDYWRDGKCVHSAACPECSADGKAEIDIIHDIENREVQATQYICRECGEQWSEAYD